MRLPLLLCLLSTACGGDLCDAPSIQAQLDAASSGEMVSVGSCRVAGALHVPAGVTLAGTGASILAGPITIQGGTFRGATLEVASGTGVIVMGSGDIEDLAVILQPGTIGVTADHATHLRISNVLFDGPLTDEAAQALPNRATRAQGASYAMVITDSGTSAAPIDLVDVDIREVGPWGALIATSAVNWTRGSLLSIVGTGVLVSGGSLRMQDVQVSGIEQGIQELPPYAIATSSADLSTQRLTIESGDGIGIIQLAGTADHEDLVVRGQGLGAINTRNATAFALHGMGSELGDNGLASLLLRDTTGVRIDDAAIRDTRLQPSIDGERRLIHAGDGLQLVGVQGSIDGAVLSGNARTGLLLDVSTRPLSDLTITNVQIEAQGASFGAIAQDAASAVASGTWDSGIMRLGAAGANDGAHTGLLAIVSGEASPIPPLPADP